jgi:hypothetical protein
LDTPSPELGSKAAACTTILSGGIVSNALRGSAWFPFDGGFNTMTRSVFHAVLLFSLYPAKKQKTGWIIDLKKKRFIDGRGCKKDLP